MSLQVTIKTKEEADAFLSFIGGFEEKRFAEEGFSKEKFGAEWEGFSWFGDIKKFISEEGRGADEVAQELRRLEKWVRGLETVRIATSFKPSEEFLYHVYDVFAGKGIKDFVVDSAVDKKIKGGAQVFCKGKYIDATLKTRVKNLLMSQDVVGKYL